MNPKKVRKYSLWALYLFLLLISSIATGESIAYTISKTDLATRLLCYFASLLILGALYSIALYYIKEAIDERHYPKASLFTIFFVAIWAFLSVWTNTHSFYIMQNMDEIRRNELNQIQGKLISLKANTTQELINMENAVQDSIHLLNSALKDQIMAPNNGGIGELALNIISKIEKHLGGKAITPYKNIANIVALAQAMYNQVNTRLDEKMQRLRAPRSTLLKVFETDKDFEPLINSLERSIKNYEQRPMRLTKNTLRQSYAKYHELMDHIRSVFNTPVFGEAGPKRLVQLEKQMGKLPKKVPSIELERISNLWWYAYQYNTNKASLRWAFLLAVSIDLVSFLVYYAQMMIKLNTRF